MSCFFRWTKWRRAWVRMEVLGAGLGTNQRKPPEPDGRAMPAASALSTDETAAGVSAKPPCAPSPSASPSSKDASMGARLLTWMPALQYAPGSSASSHAARVSCSTASPSTARSRSSAVRNDSCARKFATAAHAAGEKEAAGIGGCDGRARK